MSDEVSWRVRSGAALTLAAVVPASLAAVCSAGADLVASSATVLLLVLCVVAAAVVRGRPAAVVAAVSSGLGYDFFWTRPYGSLRIADREDVEVTCLLVVIGVVVTELVLLSARRREHGARRSGYLEGALRAAESVSRGELPRTAVLRLVEREIADVLQVPSCRYVEGSLHDPRPALLEHDGQVTRHGRPLDVVRHGLPTDESTVLSVRGGYFVIDSASALSLPSLEQRRVAVLLADLVATGQHPDREPDRRPAGQPDGGASHRGSDPA